MRILFFLAVAVVIGVAYAPDVPVTSDAIRATIASDPVLAARLATAIESSQHNAYGNGRGLSQEQKVDATIAALNRVESGAGDAYRQRIDAYTAQIEAALGPIVDDEY